MKNKAETDFEQYLRTLTDGEAESVSALFSELDRHVTLTRKESALLRADFENALLYYASRGVPLPEALNRLDASNLGGFYARPATNWYPLDDAAKIYPLSMRHDQMAVFRLSAYLKEPVVPRLLQMALTFTIKRFPSFATTVKKGFFWHYLDTAKRRYAIEPETDIPCKPLRISASNSQTFRVLYYRNRLSVEYFHILTDGTGGMVFLKTLTAEYLRLTGVPSRAEAGVLNINDTPSASEAANEFRRAGKTAKVNSFFDKPALQLSGRLSRRKPCRVLHFKMSASSVKAAAVKNGATVTAYMLALLFIASKSAMDDLKGDVSIQVPVNMRKLYPSDTLMNFAMYCGIRLPIGAIADVRSLTVEIARQLAEKTSMEAMSAMMNSTARMVLSMRYIPLIIKTPVARVVYGLLGESVFSNTLSNLGVVKMPPELEEHIESMDFVLGTALSNRVGCAMVTFGDVATLSISKMTADPSFEERLYEILLSEGIATSVEGTELL